MPRHPSFRAALAGLLTFLLAAVSAVLGTAAAAASDSAPAEEQDPLVVHLDDITPVLPRSGSVDISGTVTNVSDDTFTRVNLHAFSSQTPLIDATTLKDSAANDSTTYVGPRVTEPGTFATVDTLAPGETATFSDSVPFELFGINPELPGIYWIGIHALGDSSVPRDDVADGRARTFIPLLPRGAASQETQEAAIILPLRNRVWFDEDGRVGGTDRWARWLEEGGRLDAILDVADTAGTTPYSWLVDPAILLALTRLGAGNPARSIAPDPSAPGQEPSATETPEDSETTPPLSPSSPVPEAEQSDDERALADAADAWMARFLDEVTGRTVLTLPFGDLDVSAAVRHSPDRYSEALARGAQIMAQLRVASQPTLAPENDVLSPEALAATTTDTTILFGDNAFAAPPQTKNSVVRLLGHKIIVTSTGAESGGPGPTAADDPLAMRQRLLSEAALRLAAGDTAPVVMTLPSSWGSEDASPFFAGLSEPWLDVVAVTDVSGRSAAGVPARALAYTETDLEAELGSTNFSAATRATGASALLEEVLSLETTIQIQVLDEVLVTLSEQHRSAPLLAARSASRVGDTLRDDLGKITVEAPPAVTLSSDSGQLGATLVNGLDQPVKVRIDATTDGELTLSGSGVRELGPQARSLVRLEARTSQPGIHTVRLAVTTVDGTPLGSFDEVPIRAARVTALIWIAMAVGALVLFGAIGFRLPKQIRARRRDQAEEAAAAQAPAGAGVVQPGESG